MIRLTLTTPPVIITPIYFCPTAKVSTLSSSALKLNSKFDDITIWVHEVPNFRKSPENQNTSIQITVHNNLDYIDLPILHLSYDTKNQPHLAGLFQTGINKQYIHKTFDHHNMDMVIQMKNKDLMIS